MLYEVITDCKTCLMIFRTLHLKYPGNSQLHSVRLPLRTPATYHRRYCRLDPADPMSQHKNPNCHMLSLYTGSDPHTARITSYNVCYTKLLRFAYSGRVKKAACHRIVANGAFIIIGAEKGFGIRTKQAVELARDGILFMDEERDT